jgi:hypothetical protein
MGNDQKEKGRAGVEPATYRAATNCSTTELTPQRHLSIIKVPPGLRALFSTTGRATSALQMVR